MGFSDFSDKIAQKNFWVLENFGFFECLLDFHKFPKVDKIPDMCYTKHEKVHFSESEGGLYMPERPNIQAFLQEVNSQKFIFCGSTRNKRAIDLILKADDELEVYANNLYGCIRRNELSESINNEQWGHLCDVLKAIPESGLFGIRKLDLLIYSPVLKHNRFEEDLEDLILDYCNKIDKNKTYDKFVDAVKKQFVYLDISKLETYLKDKGYVIRCNLLFRGINTNTQTAIREIALKYYPCANYDKTNWQKDFCSFVSTRFNVTINKHDLKEALKYVCVQNGRNQYVRLQLKGNNYIWNEFKMWLIDQLDSIDLPISVIGFFENNKEKIKHFNITSYSMFYFIAKELLFNADSVYTISYNFFNKKTLSESLATIYPICRLLSRNPNTIFNEQDLIKQFGAIPVQLFKKRVPLNRNNYYVGDKIIRHLPMIDESEANMLDEIVKNEIGSKDYPYASCASIYDNLLRNHADFLDRYDIRNSELLCYIIDANTSQYICKYPHVTLRDSIFFKKNSINPYEVIIEDLLLKHSIINYFDIKKWLWQYHQDNDSILERVGRATSLKLNSFFRLDHCHYTVLPDDDQITQEIKSRVVNVLSAIKQPYDGCIIVELIPDITYTKFPDLGFAWNKFSLTSFVIHYLSEYYKTFVKASNFSKFVLYDAKKYGSLNSDREFIDLLKKDYSKEEIRSKLPE